MATIRSRKYLRKFNPNDDDDIDVMDRAMAAYAAYVECAEAIGGSARPFASDFKHWSAAARMSDDIGVDPGLFVRSQFLARSVDDRGTLTPRKVVSPRWKALENCRGMVTPSDVLLDMLSAAELRLDKAVRTGQHPSREDALFDPSMPFPSWFRVAESSEGPDGRVFEFYADAVRSELRQSPNLKKLLKERYGIESI